MQNNPNGFTFDPDTHYVVDFFTALNFPELFDPEAGFPERHFIISYFYPKSIAKMKDEISDRSVASKELKGYLRELIAEGMQTQNGKAIEYRFGNLHVIFDYNEHPADSKLDNTQGIRDMVALANYWSSQPTVKNVVILTNEPMTQISTINNGSNLQIDVFSPAPYAGYRRIRDEAVISYWCREKKIPLYKWHELQPNAEPLRPHEFIMFGKTNGFRHIGRYDAKREIIVPLSYYRQLKSITPIGELQAIAFEALMAPADEISVVILYGNAGTGKTFATIAAALEQSGIANAKFEEVSDSNNNRDNAHRKGRKSRKTHTVHNGDNANSAKTAIELASNDDYPYQSILICPPDRMLGDKMAPVPGDERTKLASKLHPYSDNALAFLRQRSDKKEGGTPLNKRDVAARADSIMNRIEVCPPGEINGRSFWNTFFICDEAQFDSLSQIKAFIERCDSGTKLALCGDPSQIDDPYNWHGNPLARAVRYLGNDPHVAIVRFDGQNLSQIKRPGAQIIARSWPRSC